LNQSGRGEGNETRSQSKDNEATGTLGTTAATGSREHRAGATRTTRTAAAGSQEHGAGATRTTKAR
jgi:hypothetical protein